MRERNKMPLEARCSGILRSALSRFGEEAQRTMLVEEVGELLTAIAQNKRGRVPESAVAEEIADVQIMLWQMEMIYCNGVRLDEIIDRKVKRLSERIERGDGMLRSKP